MILILIGWSTVIRSIPKNRMYRHVYSITELLDRFLIETTLTGLVHLDRLQQQIVPIIQAAAYNNFDIVRYHQDGVSPDYLIVVRNYFDAVFSDRWIGRRGSIAWPARSSDITSLDYNLLGYL